MPEGREEYAERMGHRWQGFTGSQLHEWLGGAGFSGLLHAHLPTDEEATGPMLFVARGSAAGDTAVGDTV